MKSLILVLAIVFSVNTYAGKTVFPGDGIDGPALSYKDNNDGTFTDNNTQLMWETKTGAEGAGTICEEPIPPANDSCEIRHR